MSSDLYVALATLLVIFVLIALPPVAQPNPAKTESR